MGSTAPPEITALQQTDQEPCSSRVPRTARFTVNAVLTAAFNLPDQNLIQEGVEDHVAEMHLKENRSLMFTPTLVNCTPPTGWQPLKQNPTSHMPSKIPTHLLLQFPYRQ